MRDINTDGIGEDLMNNILATKENGLWRVNSHMMGETIPKESSSVFLDKDKIDKYGIP